jgi:hypothetical protein
MPAVVLANVAQAEHPDGQLGIGRTDLGATDVRI